MKLDWRDLAKPHSVEYMFDSWLNNVKIYDQEYQTYLNESNLLLLVVSSLMLLLVACCLLLLFSSLSLLLVLLIFNSSSGQKRIEKSASSLDTRSLAKGMALNLNKWTRLVGKQISIVGCRRSQRGKALVVIIYLLYYDYIHEKVVVVVVSEVVVVLVVILIGVVVVVVNFVALRLIFSAAAAIAAPAASPKPRRCLGRPLGFGAGCLAFGWFWLVS